MTTPIDINSLTVGQARQIAALFGVDLAPKPVTATLTAYEPPAHPFVGRYCILRCYSAGVHAGWLVSQSGDQAVLRDARRLWSWRAKDGVALSGVAVHGLASGKIDTKLALIALTGVIETIPCTNVAQESIDAA